MAVMFVLLPVALAFAAAALAVFLWAVRTGQFDDLDTPAMRMLLDDDAGSAIGPRGGAPLARGSSSPGPRDGFPHGQGRARRRG